MKEFDEFLDKSKAPKATLPFDKKEEKEQNIINRPKDPLSQTPGLNSPIVLWD
jgi:hypothetical protein